MRKEYCKKVLGKISLLHRMANLDFNTKPVNNKHGLILMTYEVIPKYMFNVELLAKFRDLLG